MVKHFEGVCHVYLDAGCDLETGLDVALDAKCLMPEVCNAAETLLVHESHVEALTSTTPESTPARKRRARLSLSVTMLSVWWLP